MVRTSCRWKSWVNWRGLSVRFLFLFARLLASLCAAFSVISCCHKEQMISAADNGTRTEKNGHPHLNLSIVFEIWLFRVFNNLGRD